MWNLPESVDRWQVADLLREGRESDGPSLVWCVCVSHRDTPMPTEDTISLQPSSERLRGRIHEINVLLVWKSTFRHMYASTFMRLCTVWLDSETCSRARHGDPRGVEDARDLTRPHLFCNKVHLQFALYWQALVRTRHQWKRPRRIVGKTGSDIHVAITWMSVRFHGQLWRGVRSLCRCLLFLLFF